MKNKDLKQLLCDSFQMEKELYEFCIDCLKRIYGENATSIIYMFEEGVESFEYNGCIQSFNCIDSRYKKQCEESKKRMASNAE